MTLYGLSQVMRETVLSDGSIMGRLGNLAKTLGRSGYFWVYAFAQLWVNINC